MNHEDYGIYKIQSPNGSIYIGMTTKSFDLRWSWHKKDLRGNKHKCKGLQRAYAKYGMENLTFSVLETMPKSSSLEEILMCEQKWWDLYKSKGINLYNGRPTATGSVNHSDDTKARISHTAKKNALRKGLSLQSEINCGECGEIFVAQQKRKFCSSKCAALYRGKFKIGSISREEIIQAVLLGGNCFEVAKRLNIGKSSLYTLLKQHSLSIESIREQITQW